MKLRLIPSLPSKLTTASLAGVLLFALNNANAANQYFDVNGTATGYGVVNGGSYSWDDPNWATVSGGTAATGNWVGGNFARFSGGASGNAYTVTVNNDELMAGMYETVSGVSLTVNAAGSGTIDIASGDQGFLVSGSASKIIINAPISGVGGLGPELSGSLYLYGNNTYAGGTAYGYSGAPLTYFNNNNSFGTGDIHINSGLAANSFFGLLATGGSAITLNNTLRSDSANTGFNFASNPNTPVNLAGSITMGANNFNLRNSGGATSPLTVSGVISGTANLGLTANGASSIVLSGANTYSGTTTVGVGGAPVTLKLGAANTIASSSSVIMAGGVLDPGGFTHSMTSTTLGLTANSTIDFAAGAAEIDLADSSALTWTGTLNLASWDSGVDALRFGNDSSALTAAQLGMIEFNGTGLGSAGLDANGYVVVVPEPTTVSLGFLGAAAFFIARRRKS